MGPGSALAIDPVRGETIAPFSGNLPTNPNIPFGLAIDEPGAQMLSTPRGSEPESAKEELSPMKAVKSAFKTGSKLSPVLSALTGINPLSALALTTPALLASEFAEGDPNFTPGVSGPEGSAAQGGGPAFPGGLPQAQPGANAPQGPVVPGMPEAVFHDGVYYNRFTGQPITPEEFLSILSNARGL
jgi:hypothetical protein